MMAEEQFERLVGKSHQPKNLVESFRRSPLAGVDLDLARERDPGRDIMSGYLLDTNCISGIVRSKPEPRLLDWMQAADESLLYLSVLTLGNL
jgi:hypothetical protein